MLSYINEKWIMIFFKIMQPKLFFLKNYSHTIYEKFLSIDYKKRLELTAKPVKHWLN